MKATIGVYETREQALNAVHKLNDAGFPAGQLSILGKAEETPEESDEDAVEPEMAKPARVASTEMGVAAVAGTTLGILTGVGILAIPGFGFLYGAGAVIGAIAGFDAALIGGGIVSALTLLGLKQDKADAYGAHLTEGKYLLVAQGESAEIAQAKEVLDGHGTHVHVEAHD